MINFILFFLFLFSPSLSIIINNDDVTNIDFDGISYSEKYNITESKYFQIIFQPETVINEYLKIEVISSDQNKNPNLAIAFSTKDKSCLEDREQLSTGIKSTHLWLTKAQLENKDNLYINILCSDSICESELKLYADEAITMDLNTQFNLYVTENNQNIDVRFDSSSVDEYEYATIWAIGTKNVEVTSDYDERKYSKNNIYKIKKDEINSSSFEFLIKGTPGDIINIGSSSISEINYNDLIINQPEVKGFLKKEDNIEDCYSFKKDELYLSSTGFYLTGIIYSKIAEIYFRNEEGHEISGTLSVIKNGSFIQTITPNSDSPDYFCIRFPKLESEKYDINEIFYSLQLTDPGQSEINIGLYSPQIYGEIYPRRLKEGEEYSYIGIVPDDSSNKLSIDMVSQYGFPDMYYRVCKNYPLCTDYDETNSRSISGQTTYKFDKENISPMGAKQHVLFVKCLKNTNNIADYCGFKTSFNSDKTKINLKEEEVFKQYILQGESDYYKIDYSGEKIVEKIYVNLMVYTGDVNFNTMDLKLQAKKLYNSNKIYYSIILNDGSQDDIKEVCFNVSASKNSFYSIDFIFVRKDDNSWITNMIDPGVSYLITIDPEEKDSQGNKKPYKYVKFSNLKMIDTEELLVQFYSLNCKLNVTAKKISEEGYEYFEEISSFDQYYQDRVYQDKMNLYEYRLYIKDTDSSVYNNKLCMVYASSLEVISNEELNENQILISDNEPKQIVFKKMEEEIEYLYPHSNSDNDVIINVNTLDPADYEVTISFVQPRKSDIIYKRAGNDLIYLIKYEWRNYCKENEICPIIIKIKLTSTIYESNPKLLISVKTVQENNPNYITKNQAKFDFLLGNNWQFYYTDLGLNEEGFVLVSYRRGSGRLFGKIVEKNAQEPEEGANWREMYKFPTTVEESLDFYGYIKKLIIKKEETSHCKDGCYLLLSLKTSIVSENNFDFREHPFNIIIHASSSNEFNDIPIVNIPLNEYIIGNLVTNTDEYYSTIFTHDAGKIIIDFQSKVINLYINVGPNDKPTRDKEPDFKFESIGQDTIFEIKKDDFIKKCKEKGLIKDDENSLLGLSMTIGLWTNKTDSLYTTVYSMKINLPYDDRLIIYEVKSDQKNLCKVENIRGVDRCLFMIYYLGIDSLNSLILYPLIQEHSPYKMYANFIRKEKYDHFDYSDLKDIPNQNSPYSTEKTGLDYIYVENSPEDDNFLFVSVETSGKTVELLTSLYTKDLQLSPNPSSPQLFVVNNGHFLFEFTTEEDVIITIQSLNGKGKICWEVNKGVEYSLEGKDDIISLTNSLIDKSNDTEVYSNLYIKNENKKDGIIPGFVFYINYLLRPSTINLDEIEIGKSTQIAYRNTDFPIYLYSQLKDLDKDVNIYVNLYELIGINYSKLTKTVPFEITAVLVNDTTIMNAKMGYISLDNYDFDFSGSYDSLIKTGFVSINKDDIKNRTVGAKDGVNVLFKVIKNEDYPNLKNNFTRITLEAAIFQEGSDIPVVPNVYHYGKLSLKNEKNVYKLRTDKNRKIMRIHYSPNSNYTAITISTTPGSNKNSSFEDMKVEFANGKHIITFNSNPNSNNYIYLNILHSNGKAKNEKTNNYAFKYMNSNNKDDFPSFIFLTEEALDLTHVKSGNKFNYTIKFAPLPYEGIDITYLIKFVEKKDWVDGENNDCVALRESNSFVDELKDLKKEDKMLVKKYDNINEIDYKYVQIIALVKNNTIVEYVGYQNIFIKDESSSNSWKIIVIIISGIIVLLAVLFLLHNYIKKRRNIDKKVEKLSGPMMSRATDASRISEAPIE